MATSSNAQHSNKFLVLGKHPTRNNDARSRNDCVVALLSWRQDTKPVLSCDWLSRCVQDYKLKIEKKMEALTEGMCHSRATSSAHHISSQQISGALASLDTFSNMPLLFLTSSVIYITIPCNEGDSGNTGHSA